MNKVFFVAAAAAMIVAGVVALRPADTCAADAGDDAVVGAVMQIDFAPVVKQMRAMQEDIAALKDSLAAMNKATQEATASQVLMLDAVKTLAPEKWEYKIIRTQNERAVQAPGEEGWEMVAITREGWVWFKRPMRAAE